jgi:hypothetical protein
MFSFPLDLDLIRDRNAEPTRLDELHHEVLFWSQRTGTKCRPYATGYPCSVGAPSDGSDNPDGLFLPFI